jgi:hypothetical protein
MNEEKPVRSPRALVWACSVFYILALPFLVGCAWISPVVFLNTKHTMWGMFLVFVGWMVPLATLISIWSIWLNYSEKKYKRVYFYCALPILSVVILEICIQISRLVLR